MGYPVNDLVIKACIEQGIQDIIAQPWLVRDLMANITQFPAATTGYEQEVQNCSDWLNNNKINISLKYNKDTIVLPAITIALGASSEVMDMRTTADASTMNMMYVPSDIGRPIPYLIRPFAFTSYDPTTGMFGIPLDIDLSIVNPGQVILNPTTGEGFVITRVGVNALYIEIGHQFNFSKIGVFPQYPFYKAHVEQNWYSQSYSIGVHTTEPAELLWLEAIIGYTLLRYKEALLEARNFMQSGFNVSDFAPNVSFSGPENAYSRYFTLNGVTPITWTKTPARIIEAITFQQPNTIITSIKILSNLDSPTFLHTSQDPWVTVQDNN